MEFIKFESVIIVNGNLSEAAADDVAAKYFHKFEKWSAPVAKYGYTPVEYDKKGKKALAYEIKEQKEAWYYVFVFWSESKNIDYLDKLYRADKDILKFITLKLEDDNKNELNINDSDLKSEQNLTDDTKHHPLGQNHYDYLFGYTDELKT